MARTLAPIPAGVAITNPKDGSITDFFRLAWQALRDSFQQSATVATLQRLTQTAAIVTTAAYTTHTAGLYRITYSLRKTVADGVSSSLTFTWGWTETGIPLTDSDPALTTDTTGAVKSGSRTVWADASTDLTLAIAYASNTAGRMTYRADVSVEQLVAPS